jgi:nickel transport protein
MKFASRFFATACIVGSLVAASTAQAHGIWFAERATQLALIYGVGADDLDMVKRQPLLTGVAGYDADWRPVKASLRVAGPLLLVDNEEPATALTAAMDNGIWSRTPDGEWHKKGRDEVPNAERSERTFKYAVYLNEQPKAPVPALADQVLQVVPMAEIPQQLGKPIKLRVLFKGKPVAGALVRHDYVNDPDQVPLKTADDGTVTLNVRNQGLNVIAATYNGPSDQPKKYDHIEYLATLTFVLPHAPE